MYCIVGVLWTPRMLGVENCTVSQVCIKTLDGCKVCTKHTFQDMKYNENFFEMWYIDKLSSRQFMSKYKHRLIIDWTLSNVFLANDNDIGQMQLFMYNKWLYMYLKHLSCLVPQLLLHHHGLQKQIGCFNHWVVTYPGCRQAECFASSHKKWNKEEASQTIILQPWSHKHWIYLMKVVTPACNKNNSL